MDEIGEIITLLNPWWKEGEISKELALSYKRHIFVELQRLLNNKQTIISGLRRVGKTVLLYQIIESLLRRIGVRRIFYFNFNKRVQELNDIFRIYEELTGTKWRKEKNFCLF